MRKGSRMLLLLAVMLFCAVVFPVDAQAAVVASGECGENVTWTLDDAGTLTISGTGDLWPYIWDDNLAQQVIEVWEDAGKVIIEEGITRIHSELYCPNATSIEIPASATEIFTGEI